MASTPDTPMTAAQFADFVRSYADSLTGPRIGPTIAIDVSRELSRRCASTELLGCYDEAAAALETPLSRYAAELVVSVLELDGWPTALVHLADYVDAHRDSALRTCTLLSENSYLNEKIQLSAMILDMALGDKHPGYVEFLGAVGRLDADMHLVLMGTRIARASYLSTALGCLAPELEQRVREMADVLSENWAGTFDDLLLTAARLSRYTATTPVGV
jgi:hypothetical protein